MAHSANIISKVKLPGSNIEYEIHDAQAIHNAADLGLGAALVFKGTKATKAQLPSTGNKTGDVWHVTEDDYEYVWTDTGAWEELGAPHDFVGTDEYDNHIHATVTVTGTNAASSVTGQVTVPSVSKTARYITTSFDENAIDYASVLGIDTTFTATATPTMGGIMLSRDQSVKVGSDGTASAITNIDTTPVSAITSLNTTTIKNPTVTSVTIPNVTANTPVETTYVEVLDGADRTIVEAAAIHEVHASHLVDGGRLPEWSAIVENGVLRFGFEAGAMPEFQNVIAHSLEESQINTIENYLYLDNRTSTKTILGTALNASSVTTSDVSVVTGAKTSESVVSEIIPVTTTVLTGVKVTQQPEYTLTYADNEIEGDVAVVTGIEKVTVSADRNDYVQAVIDVTAPTLAIGTSANGVHTGDVVTVGTSTASIANGQAAAQKWTQGSGSTGKPSTSTN